MFEVRIHGRGGQGVVTAAEMLSVAAFLEGKHAQAFPSFGSERTGAPVVAFCRIDDKEIRLREPILEPDCLIVQDVTRPAPNTALLGAFAAEVGVVSLDSVLEAIRRAFPGKVGEGNVEAAKEAFALVAAKAAA